MPIRGVTDVSGLRDIRSLHTSGRRSMPRVQSSAYLDLYMLQKAKDRLEKEAALLAKRNQAIQKRLAEIQKQMQGLEQSARSERPSNGGNKAAEPNGPTKRKWKKFALKY